tara:strand:+ start:952 stop:1563 length:612 start_codon:yes stop_codon:yes gene_type:complete
MNDESDNESIATADIVEQEVDEEPLIVLDAETIIEPNIDSKLNEVPTAEPVVKKSRGRPKAVGNTVDKTEGGLHALTKADLMRLVVSQHEVLSKRELIDKKQEEFIKEKVTNKLVKSKKEKKPRSPAQIEATKRMIEGRKAKLTKSLAESKKEIVDEIDNSIADRVQDAVTNIIMKPMRSLTPERMKKVEEYIEPKKKNRFHK